MSILVNSRVEAKAEAKRYSKRTELPVPPELAWVFEGWIPLAGPLHLFPRSDRRGAWQRAKKHGRDPLVAAGRAAGVEDLRFRDLRRFFLLESARAGVVSGIIDMPEPNGARRCPVELRGRIAKPLLYGLEVPVLTRAEYNLADVLSLAFVDGKDGYSREELVSQTRDDAPWKTYADMRRKPGYEPWLEVLPDRKEARKGEPFRMIDPRGGAW